MLFASFDSFNAFFQFLDFFIHCYASKTGRERTYERADAKFWLEVSFTQLARAVGKGWNDLIGKPGEPATPLSEEFMREVLAKVKQIIKNLK